MENIIEVRPNLSLAERISATNFSVGNKSINEVNFIHDTTTIGKWKFKLSDSDADNIYGWKEAKIEHFLAFLEVFKEEEKYPILSLGCILNFLNIPSVICLFHYKDKYQIVLCYKFTKWPSNSKFLYVRKID